MHPTTPWNLDDLLRPKEAAPILRLTNPRSLAAWRQQGIGPRFVRIGKRAVRYRYRDLLAYIDRQTVGEG